MANPPSAAPLIDTYRPSAPSTHDPAANPASANDATLASFEGDRERKEEQTIEVDPEKARERPAKGGVLGLEEV